MKYQKSNNDNEMQVQSDNIELDNSSLDNVEQVNDNEHNSKTDNTVTTESTVAVGSQSTVKSKRKVFSVENISVVAILTAVSFILYMFVKFPLPFMFPSFLEIQFSDMPALLGGFALGPIAGSIIVIVKCCIKMFFSITACVGEIADILVGLAFVLPASIFYQKIKTKRSAIFGILIGSLCAVVVAVLSNWLFLIPFYIQMLTTSEIGGEYILLGIMQAIYPNATVDTMLAYYLPLAVLPFNIIRCAICGTITFFVYKPLSKALHWEHKRNERVEQLKAEKKSKTQQ